MGEFVTIGDDKGLHCYRAAEEAVTSLGLSVRRGEPIHLDSLLLVVPNMVDHLSHSDDLVVRALSGSIGSPLITNLIHVGILSVKLGMGLDYGRQQLEQLALAGLLHDIGIFAIPESMLLKRESLSQDERQMLEQHPELGADVLLALGADYDWLVVVVRQAHERWSGQGYPHGIREQEIHEFAQIIGVVDAFDAMVNPRPHHTRLFPQDAVRVLLNESTPAFSRELIKVLVKNLSAFPLGTTVRLNTGSLAVVSKVNRMFPMRPVVQLLEMKDEVLFETSTLIDLSKTPLVHILETLEPPAVNRFSIDPSHVLEAHREGLSSSKEVAPLLELLDSIACFMEGAVDTQSSLPPLTSFPEPVIPPDGDVPPDKEFADSEFQEEVLELFSLESQEWLLQIQSAFSELEANPPQELLPKIFDLLTRGLTNLGGSAAIVALPHLEQQAFGMVPLIQSLRECENPLTEAQILTLREQVVELAEAIEAVVGLPSSFEEEGEGDEEGDAEGSEDSWDEDPLLSGEVETLSSPFADIEMMKESLLPPEPLLGQEEAQLFTLDDLSEEPSQEPSQAGSGIEQDLFEEDAISAIPLYDALKEFHEARSEFLVSNRQVSGQILNRVEEECGPTAALLEAGTLIQFLEDHEQQDAEFFADVERRIPPIIGALDLLKEGEQSLVITEDSLNPILQGLQDLQAVVRRVNAGSLDPFLTGLLSFLKVVAYRQVSSAFPRLQAVELRVQALRQMAQQWVEIGQVERTAIRQLLPQ